MGRKPRWLLPIVALTVLVAWRAAQLEGVLRPIHVAGPSMSPTLWGPHRHVSCAACGLDYRVHWPATGTLRCFGCGQLGLRVSAATRLGDRVLIDRGAYLLSAPSRGDLVAIKMPAGGLQVKRVVGLPGDVVKISPAGKLLVDDQPLRLSPAESWERSIAVHDDRYRGAGGSRWQPADREWLVYHHRDVHNPGGSSETEVRIRDDDPANASLSRQTQPVEDLQLAVQIVSSAPCTLEVAFATSEQPLFATLRLDPGAPTVRLTKIDHTLWLLPADGPPRAIARSRPAGSSHSEERLPRGEEPLPHSEEPLPRGGAAAVDLSRPVAVRLRGGDAGLGTGPESERSCRLARLWLGRSVRFDPPRAFAARWRQGVPVAAGRYLVVGDNPPASLDSRDAPEGVAEERIIGRVHRWPAPAQRLSGT